LTVGDWPYSFEIVDVGELVVSRRDSGEHAVVDGQTRAAAIRELAAAGQIPGQVPCLVYSGLTQADEASLFVRLQRERRGMHSYERFRAAVVAGEPEAVAIKALCDRLGYRLGQQATELSAVSALENVYRRGSAVLERTLLLLRSAWGEEYMPSGDVLRGLGRLLDTTGGIEDEQLAARLKPLTPGYVKRLALEAAEGGRGGGGMELHMADALEAIYFGYAERDSARPRTCKAKECVSMAARGSEYCLAHERQAAEVRRALEERQARASQPVAA
jgi:hypothetical protein